MNSSNSINGFFALNLGLALVWAAISGAFTTANLLMGLLMGFVVLLILARALGSNAYLERVIVLLRFLLFFLKELMVSSLQVAWEVLTRNGHIKPAVLAIPLDADMTPAQISLLANTITLTPGTLSIDVSPDARALYIHAMYVEDAEAFRSMMYRDFVQRIKEVFPAHGTSV